MGSARFQFDKADLIKTAKAFGYSLASAALAAAGTAVTHVHLVNATPAQAATFALAVATVNAGIVAVKNWLDDHTQR